MYIIAAVASGLLFCCAGSALAVALGVLAKARENRMRRQKIRRILETWHRGTGDDWAGQTWQEMRRQEMIRQIVSSLWNKNLEQIEAHYVSIVGQPAPYE